MNITQFKNCLPILLKRNIVPFIWGFQGVGKTQVVSQVAKDLGYGFVHLHLATQEVGDLVGLLVHDSDGTVRHARPEWFPTEGKGVIFLDELNRAHPDVIQAMFSFITSKTIHRHKLPEGWKIVAAGNYQSEEMTVTDTSDKAWMSRFCHIEFDPTKAEFCAYAEKRGAESVADFISEHEEMLEASKRSKPNLEITPDRRAWLDMIAPLEDESFDAETRYELYKGIVGTAAASSFSSFRNSKERKLRLRDILTDYPNVKQRVKDLNKDKETRFDALRAPLAEFEVKCVDPAFQFSDTACDNFKQYLLDVPLEMVYAFQKVIGKAKFQNKERLLNDKDFIGKLVK